MSGISVLPLQMDGSRPNFYWDKLSKFRLDHLFNLTSPTHMLY